MEREVNGVFSNLSIIISPNQSKTKRQIKKKTPNQRRNGVFFTDK